MAEYIDTRINPADYIEVWEVEDSEHGKQLVMAVDDLKCLPPADVRPVIHGHWIPVTNGRGGHECSVCHNYAPSYQSGNEYLSRFCPVCGSENNGPNQ